MTLLRRPVLVPELPPEKRKRNTGRVDFDYLRPEEVAQLLAAIPHARDLAIVAVFAYLGLRCNELRMLNIDDLDWREGTLRILHAKGGKQRLLPLPEPLIPDLEGWLVEWPGVHDDLGAALFSTRVGTRISNRHLRSLVKRYGRLAGVGARIPQGLHPHALRHTTATWLLVEGWTCAWSRRCLGTPHRPSPRCMPPFDLNLKREAMAKLRVL